MPLGGSNKPGGFVIKWYTTASKEIGLEVNAEKLSTWSCLKVRMQDKITT
jgi:hypothetical protein